MSHIAMIYCSMESCLSIFESLHETGTCLLETTALHVDGESVRSGGCSISSSFKVRGCSDKSWQKPGGRFSGSSVGWAAILLQYLHFAEKFNLIRLKGQEKCDHPRRSFTHVLPTPADAKRPNSRINTAVIQSNPTSLGGSSRNLWNSSPLDTDMPEKNFMDDNLSVPTKNHS
ncbi:unnamed protein product [Ilex paraguariensis]|uniref:Uncharacterized protein n=1 Tax=Ilex paraguariensis TaxID=185542 RepID=A0ABC8TVB2_9AQUA